MWKERPLAQCKLSLLPLPFSALRISTLVSSEIFKSHLKLRLTRLTQREHLFYVRNCTNSHFVHSLFSQPFIILHMVPEPPHRGRHYFRRRVSCFTEPASQGFLLTLFPLPPGGRRLAAHPCSFRLKHNPACLSLKHQLPCLLPHVLFSWFHIILESFQSKTEAFRGAPLTSQPAWRTFPVMSASRVGLSPNSSLGSRKISCKITTYFPLNKPGMMLIDRFYFKT